MCFCLLSEGQTTPTQAAAGVGPMGSGHLLPRDLAALPMNDTAGGDD